MCIICELKLPKHFEKLISLNVLSPLRLQSRYLVCKLQMACHIVKIQHWGMSFFLYILSYLKFFLSMDWRHLSLYQRYLRSSKTQLIFSLYRGWVVAYHSVSFNLLLFILFLHYLSLETLNILSEILQEHT